MTGTDTTTILFIVGLTGVGKSTTLQALKASGLAFHLLPNRRELAGSIIIPEVQRAEGQPEVPVHDRLERFRLTARYRERHPGGMVYALGRYLLGHPPEPGGMLVFDNLRGLDEVRHALDAFPRSRFIVLDAPPLVRLQRLVGRQDSFDRTSAAPAQPDLLEALHGIEGIDKVFDVPELARLAAGADKDALVAAASIIVAEQRNYDAKRALEFLQERLDDARLLALDTSTLGIEDVRARIGAWL